MDHYKFQRLEEKKERKSKSKGKKTNKKKNSFAQDPFRQRTLVMIT